MRIHQISGDRLKAAQLHSQIEHLERTVIDAKDVLARLCEDPDIAWFLDACAKARRGERDFPNLQEMP